MRSLPVPEPRLRKVDNRTAFASFSCDKMAVGRKFYDTVVVKGTFALAPGRLVRDKEQAEVVLSDTYWDAAGAARSSLKQAGEAVLLKPRTDVIVTGTLRAPVGLCAPQWSASVVVWRRGEAVIDYHVEVFGPRMLRHAASRWSLLEADDTSEVPIRYELSYGGAYQAPANDASDDDAAGPHAERPWIVHPPNPSGVGFCDERALDTDTLQPAPRWQTREAPFKQVNAEIPPAGFGPISRSWSSRLQYAGTYDAAWESGMRADVARGLPADYPADFDPRFFQCAHPELIAPGYLDGDEQIELGGVMPQDKPYTLALPGGRIVARLVDGKGTSHVERLALDTVHVDVDAGKVYVCHRLTLDQARDVRSAEIEMEEA